MSTIREQLAAIVLFVVTLAVMGKALHAIFLEVPTEATMGVVQRIFYFKVASAAVAFLAFAVSAFSSGAWLKSRDLKWDRWAVSSAEIGLVFCSVVLVTGPIWAKPVWGIWWTWDAKLTSTFILWVMYGGYLLMRGFLEDPARRASLSAVLSIIAFLDVPIVYCPTAGGARRHPQPVIAGGPDSGLDPAMWLGLIQTMAALVLLGAFLMYQRLELEKGRHQVEALRREVLS